MEPQSTVEVTITVNDEQVKERIPPRTLLSEFLRDYRNLTGTHRGCETAKCGACTVMLEGDAVKSCNVLAVQADGREVTTVEGLADGQELHPVQEEIWEAHGMQCGFCTPGIVMNATSFLQDNEDPSATEIQEALAGNICRCTGYTKVVEGVQQAAERMNEEGSR
jgi:carbon-monoxide dehydrogenase small subunit